MRKIYLLKGSLLENIFSNSNNFFVELGCLLTTWKAVAYHIYHFLINWKNFYLFSNTFVLRSNYFKNLAIGILFSWKCIFNICHFHKKNVYSEIPAYHSGNFDSICYTRTHTQKKSVIKKLLNRMQLKCFSTESPSQTQIRKKKEISLVPWSVTQNGTIACSSYKDQLRQKLVGDTIRPVTLLHMSRQDLNW